MDTSKYQKAPNIVGDDAKDTALLNESLGEAQSYILNFSWAGNLANIYLADGVGGVFAVFLVEFDPPTGSGDRFLWIIVGDIPSAYLVTEDIDNPSDALLTYCDLMQDWADAVLSDGALDDVFPVQAPPTAPNARALLSRIKFLREKVLRPSR